MMFLFTIIREGLALGLLIAVMMITISTVMVMAAAATTFGEAMVKTICNKIHPR